MPRRTDNPKSHPSPTQPYHSTMPAPRSRLHTGQRSVAQEAPAAPPPSSGRDNQRFDPATPPPVQIPFAQSAAPPAALGRVSGHFSGMGTSIENVAGPSINPTPRPSSALPSPSPATRKPASVPNRSKRKNRKVRATAFPYSSAEAMGKGGPVRKDGKPREEEDGDAGAERQEELEDGWAILEREAAERRQRNARLAEELLEEQRRQAEAEMKAQLEFGRPANEDERMERIHVWAQAQRTAKQNAEREAAEAREKEKAEKLQLTKEKVEWMRSHPRGKLFDRMFTGIDEKLAALRAGTLTNVPFSDFPWPVMNDVRSPTDITLVSVRDYVFHPLRRAAEGKSLKEKVTAELLIFHPDKFNALFLPKVREGERDMAREAAGLVAGFLNRLKAIYRL